jgi:hypothetical protein
MSDDYAHGHHHAREHAASPPPSFRFELFADAPSAQAAFEAAFPVGSSIDPALQALVNMGAQCKAAGPGTVACRYAERQRAVAGWCWSVALDGDSERRLQRVLMSSSAVGT